MRIDEYIYHLEKDIRQEDIDGQFKEKLRLCLNILQLGPTKEGDISSELSPTVKEPFNQTPPSKEKEYLWDKEILEVVSNRDLDTIHRLGFPNIIGMIKIDRKNVYITNEQETIVFSRSKYNSEYPNEGPMVGKNEEEIKLFNKCDWWVIARYEPDKKDYKDYAVFDCRIITVGNISGDITFSSPHPDGSQIINRDTWFKVLGLQRREG